MGHDHAHAAQPTAASTATSQPEAQSTTATSTSSDAHEHHDHDAHTNHTHPTADPHATAMPVQYDDGSWWQGKWEGGNTGVDDGMWWPGKYPGDHHDGQHQASVAHDHHAHADGMAGDAHHTHAGEPSHDAHPDTVVYAHHDHADASVHAHHADADVWAMHATMTTYDDGQFHQLDFGGCDDGQYHQLDLGGHAHGADAWAYQHQTWQWQSADAWSHTHGTNDAWAHQQHQPGMEAWGHDHVADMVAHQVPVQWTPFDAVPCVDVSAYHVQMPQVDVHSAMAAAPTFV
ncbi:hypothetical protein GGF31_005734 [Allomyces arbusculus]|nr:hypothetical protein GGF31_005734 [Allomyces arbusculus]